MVMAHLARGYSLETFPGQIMVTRQTVYNWMDRYPEFAAAVDIGRSKGLMAHEDVLMRISTGELEGNPTPRFFMLKYQHRQLCGDQPTVTLNQYGGSTSVIDASKLSVDVQKRLAAELHAAGVAPDEEESN